MNILLPVLIVCAIGLIAGVGLSIASILMAVPVDQKETAVREALPGANCGACGYTGCDGYAKAVAAGEAPANRCAPGGGETARKLGEILGVSVEAQTPRVAVVRCLGHYDNTTDKMEYHGVMSCAAAAQHFGGVTACPNGCMGLGDCVNACPFGAIRVCNGVAMVDEEKCTACSQCVAACPKHLIELVPRQDVAVVRCRNRQKGAETRKVCKAGCIGCMKCEKLCPTGAITVTNFLAHVDYDKCTGCNQCVENCPVHVIVPLTKA